MNANGRNHYEDWDLFALGVLDDQEQREMSAHLSSGCDDCARLYLAAKAVVAGMATLTPEEPLPPGAELRMRTRLGLGGPPVTAPAEPVSHGGGWRFWPAMPWALATICLVGMIGLWSSLRNLQQELQEQKRQNAENQRRIEQLAQLPPQPAGGISAAQAAELQNTISSLRGELKGAQSEKLAADQAVKAAQGQLAEAEARVHELDASLKDAEERRSQAEEALSAARVQLAQAQASAARLVQASTRNDQIISLLESAPLSQLDLKPTGGVQASARVYWQNDRGLLLVARDLPPLPQHGSFQLWFYRQGTPALVNVGVVQLEKPGTGLLFVPPGPALLEMAGALITEEAQNNAASTPGQEILKIKP